MATGQVTTVRRSFLKRKGMLAAFAAQLNEASIEALAELKRLMGKSSDEKTRKECAELILEKTIGFAKIRNDDQMARMLAEFKFNPDTFITNDDGEDDEGLKLDFTTVQYEEN